MSYKSLVYTLGLLAIAQGVFCYREIDSYLTDQRAAAIARDDLRFWSDKMDGRQRVVDRTVAENRMLEGYLRGDRLEGAGRNLAEVAAEQARRAALARKPFKNGLASILADPERSADLRVIKAADVDRDYAAYFGKAGLSPEKVFAVKKLLTDLKMAEADAAVLLPGGLGGAEKARAVAEVTQGVHAELLGLLGEAAYGSLNAYGDGSQTRNDVHVFSTRLAERNLELTEAQSAQLEARWSDTKASTGSSRNTFSPTEAERFATSLTDIISGEQQRTLKNYLMSKGNK